MNALAVVMAGGHGTRFWPLSRRSRPKQLLRLFGDESMLSYTLGRLAPMVSPERTYVVTGRVIEEAVAAEAPEIPPENLLAEPQGRNTAPCVALAAVLARRRAGPETVLAVLPADHYIADAEAFQSAFRSAVAYAELGEMVTLGITPTRPEPGYGYLKFGDFAAEIEGASCRARRLLAFVEKPSPSKAAAYLKEGRYLWNSGMFFFRVDTVLEEFGRHLPDVLSAMERVADADGSSSFDGVLEEVYRDVASVSIDYGIMEKSDRLVTLPASFGWSDVGNWRALLDFRGDETSCFTLGRVISEECHEAVLVAGEGVTLVGLGVEKLAVVACGDVTLVAPLDRAQEVRRLVELVRRHGLDAILE